MQKSSGAPDHVTDPAPTSHASNSNGADAAELPRFAKRQRLTMACSQCRRRKVRCDEGVPRCSHCTQRNEECVTTHPKTSVVTDTRRRTSQLPSPRPGRSNNGAGTTGFYQSSALPQSNNEETNRNGNSVQSSTLTADRHSFTPVNIQQGHHSSVVGEESTAGRSPYDDRIMINTDESVYRRKMVGGNSLQALARYLDLYFQHKGWQVIGARFAYGMQFVEEGPHVTLDLVSHLPKFPPARERQQYIDAFFQRIHPVFPILNMDRVKASIEETALIDDYRISAADISLLAISFAVLSLGADEYAGTITETGTTYLEAAYSLFGFVVASPYLHAIQALLLLTIALRGRNKDGAAWHTLGPAIRIAYSVGLHRALQKDQIICAGPRQYHTDEELDARVWWTCYCLDKMMSMECGRPSAIRDIDCNQNVPVPGPSLGSYVFVNWIGLAQIQSRLVDMLYHRRPSGQNAVQLLKDIGTLDSELCKWAARVEPEEIRPTLDLLCPAADLHAATFLSLQFYQTMITIHQAGLMLDESTYQSKVKMYCTDGPIQARLLASESILVNSGRRIANLQIEAADRRISSRLFTTTPIMLSMVVLSFNIMKHTGERRNKTDLELLSALSQYAESEYAICGQDPRFYQFCVILRDQIRQHVYGETPTRYSADTTTQTNGYHHSPRTETTDSQYSHDSTVKSRHDDIESSGPGGEFHNLFGNVALEDPWSLLLSDDNAAIESLFMMSGSQ